MSALDAIHAAKPGTEAGPESSPEELKAGLAELVASLEQALAAPTIDAAAAFENAAAVLPMYATALPNGDCANACMATVTFFMRQGDTFGALRPAHDAVLCAQAVGEPLLVQQALTLFGSVLASIGNFTGAFEQLADAIASPLQAADQPLAAATWSALGSLCIATGLPRESSQYFDRAISVAAWDPRTSAAVARLEARINLGYTAYFLGNYEAGLPNALVALDGLRDASTEPYIGLRATAEALYALLLLEVEAGDMAKTHAATAEAFAERSSTLSATLVSELASGLISVCNGAAEVGLERIAAAADSAASAKNWTHIALRTNIRGLEAAGKAESARACRLQLTKHMRELRSAGRIVHRALRLEQFEQRRDHPSATPTSAVTKSSTSPASVDVGTEKADKLQGMAIGAEVRAGGTGERCFRVGRLAALLGRAYGFDDETCSTLEFAARLHDIGKIGVLDSHLRRSDLTRDDELDLIRTHTTTGAELLVSHGTHLQMAAGIASFHHEHWDGSGYPLGIAGKAIPLPARIAAVAIAFDAVAYRLDRRVNAGFDEALAAIANLAGHSLDPHLADAFVKLIPTAQQQLGDLHAHLCSVAHEHLQIRALQPNAIT